MPYLIKTIEQAKDYATPTPRMVEQWEWLIEEVKVYNVYATSQKLSKRLYLAAETETKICVFVENAGMLPNRTTDIPAYTLFHDETGWNILGDYLGYSIEVSSTRLIIRRQLEALLGISIN
ncbi:hypothetical protein [Vibrio phage vB_VmeM-Yong XC32]|nr:hypothetical protein [Vibrio phage vB_VmeM-Yong XC31]QAX96538.1 hypothetical protein [Vibrio phage vB_VmeM-Yong XC32]QAX96856.1 hypothetical protein [Vibrio phage vB_VmeM-Yong MS31]QAX97161.1 hypothetical protein [Vibrio phage vB_VmeM-Yong MS32]